MDDFDHILGVDAQGQPVNLLQLANEHMRVGLTNFGARMLSIEVPDRDGGFAHVLLGFSRSDMILRASSFGAVLGRFANRIAGGQFTLGGEQFTLSQNDGRNTLHGGKQAFSKRFWSVENRTKEAATFKLVSADGDQGFPGELHAKATYRLEDNALRLELEATTTKPCPVNLSAHPYFNLAGMDAIDMCDHELTVNAESYLPTDAEQIPTGEISSVAGTVFDFRSPVVIGSRIRRDDPQMLVARGIDHCFVLNGQSGLRHAATLFHPASGRQLDVETDRAGLQVYTGNSLDGSLIGHGGTYRQTAGLALEAQAYPDAPNQPNFPSTVLRPGDVFRATILYRFSTR